MAKHFEDCPLCFERFDVTIADQDEYHTTCPHCHAPLRLQRVEYVVADEMHKEEMDPDVTVTARKPEPPEPRPTTVRKGYKR
jgi:hypothetical protein